MPDTTFYATSYSPPRNGVSDDVPAVQSAVNAAAAAGGGKVVLAEGNWTFKSQLVLKTGVTLEGMGRGIDPNSLVLYGTVVNVRWGSGSGAMDNVTKAAVLMESNSRMRSFAFNYPDQSASDFTPAEYGPTVKFYETSTTRPYHAQNQIEDMLFYKSYVAIDARGESAQPSGASFTVTSRIDNVLMSALRYGIRLSNVTDWVFLNRVEQQPGLISAGLYAPGTSLRDYVQKNCRFIELTGLLDWIQLVNCSAWAVQTGIDIVNGQGPITLTNVELDACRTCIQLSGNGGELQLKCVNSTFTAFDSIQKVANVNNWSGYVVAAANNSVYKGISFDSCYLFGPSKGWGWFGGTGQNIRAIRLSNSNTRVSGAVGGSGPAFITGTGADDLIVTGNFFEGVTAIASGAGTVTADNNVFL